uniref:Uncharacterized protein n=1 Tax=Poecilia mexicana TaxID=48701 RepID=A0A3B3Z4E2_9TELE
MQHTVGLNLLRVHDAQLGIGILDVVHVPHCSFQSTHHSFSMLSHFGISDNGSIGGQVSEGSKMPLSPGIHNQKPGSPDQSLLSNLTHVNLSPQSCDGLALSICPLNHGDELNLSLCHRK